MSNKRCDIIEKLNKIASNSIITGDYEKALAAIAASANIQYEHNQSYVDENLEKLILNIKEKLFVEKKNICNKDNHKNKTVLFYDGFGLDTRGLALIFLKALTKNNYKVIYVTKKGVETEQPEIHKVLKGYDTCWKYIDMDTGYLPGIKELYSIFEDYNPEIAFLYTTPFDVAAMVVFEYYEQKTVRYQVDLTDHAFWLGKYAFDYCIELRDVGSKISYNYRQISSDKLVMLPYYANIDKEIPFEGFSFPTDGHRIIFSGGALYKTLGDKENKYYKIVSSILKRHNDIIFLYAGKGDDSELKKVACQYPNRVFHIPERKDLYQVMKRCTLYLNTYPMFGGMMMNYAASAGKLPITLKHNHDADGLLFNQSEIGIEYESMDELIEDVDRLLLDPVYLETREKNIEGCVITEERFEQNLKDLLEKGNTEFNITLEYIDTHEFQREYEERFKYREVICDVIAKRKNKSLLTEFPLLFIEHFCRREWRKIVRKFGGKND